MDVDDLGKLDLTIVPPDFNSHGWNTIKMRLSTAGDTHNVHVAIAIKL